MFRGFCKFKCDQCGQVFMGMNCEYAATIYVAPVKCPNCGSWHTMPAGLLSYLQKRIYKEIWKRCDELNKK